MKLTLTDQKESVGRFLSAVHPRKPVEPSLESRAGGTHHLYISVSVETAHTYSHTHAYTHTHLRQESVNPSI